MKNRKLNRLKNFDYRLNAVYFITSNCKNKISYFGKIINGEMILNENGILVKNQIEWLQTKYPYLIIHNYVVMPNHIHLLLEIDTIRTGLDLSLQQPDTVRTGRDLSLQQQKTKSISSIIGALKTTTSKQIRLLGTTTFEWQRSFHDHIVRNSISYENIFNYITDNPKRWDKDIFNPKLSKELNL